jgi:hypothetical protein
VEELIGLCGQCEKPIHCKMGFLEGIVLEDKSLVCFDCAGEEGAEVEAEAEDKKSDFIT